MVERTAIEAANGLSRSRARPQSRQRRRRREVPATTSGRRAARRPAPRVRCRQLRSAPAASASELGIDTRLIAYHRTLSKPPAPELRRALPEVAARFAARWFEESRSRRPWWFCALAEHAAIGHGPDQKAARDSRCHRLETLAGDLACSVEHVDESRCNTLLRQPARRARAERGATGR